jgi:acetoin:2,6-dichlorophenolindophenol oxidoreductase subunit beta
MAEKNYAAAMLDVLGSFMEEDPHFAVLGNEVLGIGPEGAQFEPFQKRYGDRIYFPPCSEAAYTALAAGAAMCGHRIFAHLGLASFTYPAISSLANEISTARVSSGGTIGVPATLHISHGLLHGGGAQHSESPFSSYWNLPGIEIAVPSGAREVKGLLRTAIESENPTIVLTHAFGYGLTDEVPDEDYSIPFGVADLKRTGGDVTIVACSTMVGVALEAAGELAGQGIEAEVVDLRTLVPLDERTILDSVGKTGRLIVVDEGRMRCGVASEIAATVSEKAFAALKAPVGRVARLDAPVAANQIQEAYISPSAEKIVAAAKRSVGEVPAGAVAGG